MRTFEQLSKQEREDALNHMTDYLVYEIITGMFTIEFTNKMNQRVFNVIMREAAAQDSVRFAQEHLGKHPGIRSEIVKISLIVCGDALYDEKGNIVKDTSQRLI